jgi:hypothetical protein
VAIVNLRALPLEPFLNRDLETAERLTVQWESDGKIIAVTRCRYRCTRSRRIAER